VARRSGSRSVMAVNKLPEAGFKNVYNIEADDSYKELMYCAIKTNHSTFYDFVNALISNFMQHFHLIGAEKGQL
jgi:hypothetical protein